MRNEASAVRSAARRQEGLSLLAILMVLAPAGPLSASSRLGDQLVSPSRRSSSCARTVAGGPWVRLDAIPPGAGTTTVVSDRLVSPSRRGSSRARTVAGGPRTWLDPIAPDADTTTVGLVLSGGAARGFAHIGVLRVLEQAGVPIDVITGTSMGALIGALYAIGYTPEQLERLATRQDWEALFTDVPDRGTVPIETKLAGPGYLLELPITGGRVRLPRGLVAGQRISQLVTRLTWPVHATSDFHDFPIPFAAVATDLETGEAVTLRGGYLPDVLRASMAIPSIFVPAELEGRALVDGGVARNLPAEDALDLGADFLICVDVTEPLQPADSLRSLLDILDQTLSYRPRASTEQQRLLCDALIEPSIAGFSALSFDRAEEWISRGAEAARRAVKDLSGLEAVRRSPTEKRGTDVRIDSVYVDELALEGLDRASRRFVRGILNLDIPGWLTPDDVDDAIARLYNTDLFSRVTYRLQMTDGPGVQHASLLVRTAERARDRIGFSYRYDSRYKASLLLSVTLHNLLRFGSVARFHFRLGEQLQLVGEYARRSGPGRLALLGTRAEYSRSPIELFEGALRVAEVDVDVLRFSGYAGVALGGVAVGGLRIKGEYAHVGSAIAAEEVDTDDVFYTLAGMVRAETYDRDAFPTRGISLMLKSEWADDAIGSGATFAQHLADISGYLPLTPWMSLMGRATLGSTSGSDRPLHYAFFLGGANRYYLFPDRHFPFYGLDTQERRGDHLQSFMLGAQFEPIGGFLAGLAWNAGNTMDEWDLDPTAYINGYGVMLGARSLFGNVRLVLSETELSEWPDVTLDVGYRF